MQISRMRVRYHGRVQGVGFRMTVNEIASKFTVCGKVCNVDDGTVDLVAEGEEEVLLALRDEIARVMARNIVQAQESWSQQSAAEFRRFSIGPDIQR